jgi:hypothetical protein
MAGAPHTTTALDRLSFCAGFLADLSDVPRLWWLSRARASVEQFTLTEAALLSAWALCPVFSAVFDCAPPPARPWTVVGASAVGIAVSLRVVADVRRHGHRAAPVSTIMLDLFVLECTFVALSTCADSFRVHVLRGATRKKAQARGAALFSLGNFVGYLVGGALVDVFALEIVMAVQLCAFVAFLCAVCSPCLDLPAEEAEAENETEEAEPAEEVRHMLGAPLFWLALLLNATPVVTTPLTVFLAQARGFRASMLGVLGASASLLSGGAALLVEKNVDRTTPLCVAGLVVSSAAFAALNLLVERGGADALAAALPVTGLAAAVAQTAFVAVEASRHRSAFAFSAAALLPLTSKFVGYLLVVWMCRATGVAEGEYEALPLVVFASHALFCGAYPVALLLSD